MKIKYLLHLLGLLLLLCVSAFGAPVRPTAAAPEANPLTLVSQFGGTSRALDHAANTTYLGVGPRLVLVDTSTPASPTILGFSALLPALIEDVLVSGNTTLLAIGGSGVQIVDTTLPASPALLGAYDTDGTATALALNGTRLYAADGDNGLVTLTVAVPTTPDLLDTDALPVPGFAYDLLLDGSTLFLAGGAAGVRSYSLTNPSNPALNAEAYVPLLPDSMGLAADANYLYVADLNEGLVILDKANIANPPVGQISFAAQGGAMNITLDGTTAYIMDGNGDIHSVNVANPAAPTLIATFNTPGNAMELLISGGLGYIADNQANLTIYNFGAANQAGSLRLLGRVMDVASVGAKVYTASESQGVFEVNPALPYDQAFISQYDSPGLAYALQVQGLAGFVADSNQGLRFLDLSVSPPASAGQFNTSNARDVALDGTFAYVADSGNGLQIVDLSAIPPADGGTVALPNGGNATGIAVFNGFAYLAAAEGGLMVVDLVVPGFPTYHFDAPGINARDVDVGFNPFTQKTYAYLADDLNGLRIVDVSDPAAMTQVSLLAPGVGNPGAAQGVTLSGNIAFLAYGSSVRLVNIANPASPTYAGSFTIAGGARRISLDGSRAYVAAQDGGVYIFTYDTTDLSITKTDNLSNALAGDTLTYIVTVTNNGSTPAIGAVVQDTLPALLQSPSWTCVPNSLASSCSLASGTSNINNVVSIAAGDFITLTLTGVVAFEAVDNISNTAKVLPPLGQVDADLSDNVATDATTLPSAADLEITSLVNSGPVMVNNPATITVTVTNLGPSQAASVTLSSAFPADVPITGTTPTQGSCQDLGGTLSCDFGTLPAAQSAGVEISVNTPMYGDFTLNFTVSQDETLGHDLVLTNNTAPTTLTVIPLLTHLIFLVTPP